MTHTKRSRGRRLACSYGSRECPRDPTQFVWQNVKRAFFVDIKSEVSNQYRIGLASKSNIPKSGWTLIDGFELR